MAMTNLDFRRMVTKSRGGVVPSFAPLTVPDRVPLRFDPEPRLPARREAGPSSRDLRTVEIVWAPTPAPSGGRWLGGLATAAKLLAVPLLLAGGLYAKPAYDCHKQKSYGMLYYGTTVQMCVNERMAERFESVQSFVDRQMRAL